MGRKVHFLCWRQRLGSAEPFLLWTPRSSIWSVGLSEGSHVHDAKVPYPLWEHGLVSPSMVPSRIFLWSPTILGGQPHTEHSCSLSLLPPVLTAISLCGMRRPSLTVAASGSRCPSQRDAEWQGKVRGCHAGFPPSYVNWRLAEKWVFLLIDCLPHCHSYSLLLHKSQGISFCVKDSYYLLPTMSP